MTEEMTRFPGQTANIDNKFLLQAVEQCSVSIVITDAQANIVYVNPQFSAVTGYRAEEVIGKNPRILKGEDGLTDYADLWQTLLAGHQWRGEFHNRRKDGSFFWELASISPIRDEAGDIFYFLGVKEDITERKMVEEQLYQTVSSSTQLASSLEMKNFELEKAQKKLDAAYRQLKDAQSQMLQREKMASIGQLAAGVAHEINNPMGFISSNLHSFGKYLEKIEAYIDGLEDLLKRDESLWSAGQELRKKAKIEYLLEDCGDLLAESFEGAERVRKIVQNLKTFSHVDAAQEQLADLNQCLDDTINIAWNEIKYKATLTRDFGEIPTILCCPQELNQVFMNILINAAQAIEAEGEIIVATSADDNWVQVEIKDNGAGIPEEIQARIFEPFFTTKKVGEGAGLGMSISYEIVKKHGGQIEMESKRGNGTTFRILLPRNRPAAMEAPDDSS